MVPNGTTWVSNGSQMAHKWVPKVPKQAPKGSQRGPKGVDGPKWNKMGPRAALGRRTRLGGPEFFNFLTEHDPSKGPFLKKLEFEGDPQIIIFGTEATLVSAKIVLILV